MGKWKLKAIKWFNSRYFLAGPFDSCSFSIQGRYMVEKGQWLAQLLKDCIQLINVGPI